MISNHLSLIEHLRKSSNDLSCQVASWVAAGGTIEQAEPFKFEPRPLRKEAEYSAPAQPEPGQTKRTYQSQIAARMAYVASIREMAKTMTIDQAMAATGKSESAMRRAAQEGDFTFKSKHADLDRDMKLIERLTALRDAGISRFSGCKQVEISDTLLRRLEMQYDFSYPKRWSKRP